MLNTGGRIDNLEFSPMSLPTLVLPEDPSMGRLYYRSAEGCYQESGEARGNVRVSNGSEICLEVAYEGAAHLPPLAALPSDGLTSLDTGFGPPSDPESPIADADLAYPQGLTDLRILDLRGANVIDQGLVQLRSSMNPGWLCLVETDVCRTGIAYFGDESQLETLQLWSIQLSHEGLRAIARSANLSNLPLFGCERITDDGLGMLSQL